MKVKVASRVYEMSAERFKALLTVAEEQVPRGVYAVEKQGYAELMNLRCDSRSKLKQARRAYKAQGFKVYSNG